MQKEEEGERSDFSRLSVWFRSLLARVGIPVYLAWRTGNESNEGSVSVLIGFWYSCFSGCLWREHATALSAHRDTSEHRNGNDYRGREGLTAVLW